MRFLVLGALLLAGRRLLFPVHDAGPPLVVQVASATDADAVRRAIVDAALVDEAMRAGWPLGDPVVRDRLREAAGAAGYGGARTDGDAENGDAENGDAESGEVLARTLAAIDPVMRARLAWIGRELVRTRTVTRAPTAAELGAYRSAHATRYDPPWISFRQRAVTTARHGARADADARALAASLVGAGPGVVGGDPSLLPAGMSGTPSMIDARFGPGFAARLAELPAGRWSGPVTGTFGAHVVWREPVRAADDVASRDATATHDAVAMRVARDWAHDRHEEDLRRAIDELVARRRVIVREVRATSGVTP
ncbi:MAG TPA: hypothetical protein VM261_25680 [Kofleriaceae bacterium]|nr:hypothetical protein [Kofleriaceae bacterium]